MSKTLWGIAFALVVIGAVNWGLVGLAQFDLVATLFGAGTSLSRIVYSLVGLAGVLLVVTELAFRAESAAPARTAVMR